MFTAEWVDMADESPRRKYRTARKRLEEGRDSGDVPQPDYDAIIEFLDAKDPDKVSVHPGYDDDGETLKTKKASTLWSYATRLNRVASRIDTPLTDADADTINTFHDSLLSGEHPDVKDDGLSANTVNGYQSTLRKFYQYHDFGPEYDAIVTVDPENNSVKERHVFESDDIQGLRDAVDHPRDRALLEMLLYTGQRIRALLTLRLKDVDPNEGASGVFYLNTEADGLKGADEVGQKRPLLGAQKAVREWINYHPIDKDKNPEAALFVPKRNGRGEFTEPIGHSAAWKVMRDLKETAGVEKPCNPHNFRHTAVTIMKREYDLDDGEIKWMIGHKKDSRVMNTTYAHLSDDDRRENIEVQSGYKEPEEEGTIVPPVCPTCDEPLPDGAKACPSCGTVFTPDAHQAQEEIEGEIRDAKDDADDLEEHKKLDKLERLVDDNPELVDVLESMVDD